MYIYISFIYYTLLIQILVIGYVYVVVAPEDNEEGT